MGMILRFPRVHARASTGSRAAKAVNNSAVTPPDRAVSVPRTADHHSEGIASRCHHLETVQALAPGMSEAIPSRDGHKSITSRKRRRSDMPDLLGQSVPKCKDFPSHDGRKMIGHTVRMTDDLEKMAETAWREGFRLRIKQARGDRTQQTMAELLGITQTTYSKYEGQRASMMPTRLLPKFCKICAVSLEWLIEGDKATISAPKTTTRPNTEREAPRRRIAR